jgi:hypothetical protein
MVAHHHAQEIYTKIHRDEPEEVVEEKTVSKKGPKLSKKEKAAKKDEVADEE